MTERGRRSSREGCEISLLYLFHASLICEQTAIQTHSAKKQATLQTTDSQQLAQKSTLHAISKEAESRAKRHETKGKRPYFGRRKDAFRSAKG